MKKQSIWVFQWRKSVHYWWSYILFSPECKELTSMLDPLLYRWGVLPVVIRCVHWTMQMWVLQTWIKALGLYIVMSLPVGRNGRAGYRAPVGGRKCLFASSRQTGHRHNICSHSNCALKGFCVLGWVVPCRGGGWGCRLACRCFADVTPTTPCLVTGGFIDLGGSSSPDWNNFTATSQLRSEGLSAFGNYLWDSFLHWSG